jgi:adenosine/AMP kinase
LKLNKDELYLESLGIEAEKDVEERKHFLRKIGYKM